MKPQSYLEWWYKLGRFNRFKEYAFLKVLVLMDKFPKLKQIANWIEKERRKLKMMWRCNRCQTKFPEEEIYQDPKPDGTISMQCPKCHNNVLMFLSKCNACGEYEVSSKVTGLCKDCLSELQTRMAIFKQQIKDEFALTEEQWERLLEVCE